MTFKYIYDFIYCRDMKEANTIGADKYFHSRGNYDAAQHGTGGRHAARVIRYQVCIL
jgi:hypothetical protein